MQKPLSFFLGGLGGGGRGTPHNALYWEAPPQRVAEQMNFMALYSRRENVLFL